MRAGFSDLNFSIHEQISEGDKVASRFEWTGTHTGVFLGIPATGKPVRVWGIVIDQLQDGKIKNTREAKRTALKNDFRRRRVQKFLGRWDPFGGLVFS